LSIKILNLKGVFFISYWILLTQYQEPCYQIICKMRGFTKLYRTLLDKKINAEKLAFVLSISFIPILLNCLIYLLVLYGIEEGGTLSDMLYKPSFLGLGLSLIHI